MSDRYTTAPMLRADLTLPSIRLALGPVVYDQLKELLGFDPRTALAPLLRAAPYVQTTGCVAVEVLPLAIAPGVHGTPAQAGHPTPAQQPLLQDSGGSGGRRRIHEPDP